MCVCVCVYVCMCVLQEVNYSHNEIEEIADLSPHHSLRTLILDGTHTHTPTVSVYTYART